MCLVPTKSSILPIFPVATGSFIKHGCLLIPLNLANIEDHHQLPIAFYFNKHSEIAIFHACRYSCLVFFINFFSVKRSVCFAKALSKLIRMMLILWVFSKKKITEKEKKNTTNLKRKKE